MRKPQNKNTSKKQNRKSYKEVSQKYVIHPEDDVFWIIWRNEQFTDLQPLHFSFQYLAMTNPNCPCHYKRAKKLSNNISEAMMVIFEWFKRLSQWEKIKEHFHDVPLDNSHNKLTRDMVYTALRIQHHENEVLPTLYQYALTKKIRIIWLQEKNVFSILFIDFEHDVYPRSRT